MQLIFVCAVRKGPSRRKVCCNKRIYTYSIRADVTRNSFREGKYNPTGPRSQSAQQRYLKLPSLCNCECGSFLRSDEADDVARYPDVFDSSDVGVGVVAVTVPLVLVAAASAADAIGGGGGGGGNAGNSDTTGVAPFVTPIFSK